MKINAGLAALLLLAAVPAAHAGGLGAAISYTRYDTDFDFGNTAIENADVEELGLTIGESITPLFDLALQGGYTRLDLDNHPAADGYDLTGRFFGIVARTEPTLIPALLSLRIQAAYRWHDVDNGRLDHQYDELTWYETELRAGPVLNVGPVEIAAGGYYAHYDGEEEARGPLTFRRDFSAGDNSGAFATVALILDDGGRIGVYAQTGTREGYGITFSTGF
ncbi:MAG TPA: hypothetical protein VFK45_03985 [Gammaproteobacteria bacterium]|nr:hypothetical protein [Gammaproteobacteria bacterium]